MKNSGVRIVGGVLKRTVLPVGDAQALRPTPDRVRETLFNWIGESIVDARCLDLYAGSGALGIEAASRGAAHIILNDSNAKLVSHLTGLLARLGASNDEQTRRAISTIFLSGHDAVHALRLLNGAGERFDLIFLDPPFGSGALATALPAVLPVLAIDGQIYVESGAPLAPDLLHKHGLFVHRGGRAGQVHYHLLIRG